MIENGKYRAINVNAENEGNAFAIGKASNGALP